LITGTVPREAVGAGADAAGVFHELLKEGFCARGGDGVNASDEAGLVERKGHDVHVVRVRAEYEITKPADMEWRAFTSTRAQESLKMHLVPSRRPFSLDRHRIY